VSKLTYNPVPGLLVRCLYTARPSVFAHGDELLPVKGTLYTIREVGVCVRSAETVLTLRELPNPKRRYGNWDYATQPAFPAERFVPVDPKAIDVFREIAKRVSPLSTVEA